LQWCEVKRSPPTLQATQYWQEKQQWLHAFRDYHMLAWEWQSDWSQQLADATSASQNNFTDFG